MSHLLKALRNLQQRGQLVPGSDTHPGASGDEPETPAVDVGAPLSASADGAELDGHAPDDHAPDNQRPKPEPAVPTEPPVIDASATAAFCPPVLDVGLITGSHASKAPPPPLPSSEIASADSSSNTHTDPLVDELLEERLAEELDSAQRQLADVQELEPQSRPDHPELSLAMDAGLEDESEFLPSQDADTDAAVPHSSHAELLREAELLLGTNPGVPSHAPDELDFSDLVPELPESDAVFEETVPASPDVSEIAPAAEVPRLDLPPEPEVPDVPLNAVDEGDAPADCDISGHDIDLLPAQAFPALTPDALPVAVADDQVDELDFRAIPGGLAEVSEDVPPSQSPATDGLHDTTAGAQPPASDAAAEPIVEDDADSQVSNSTVGVRRQPVNVTEIADLQDDVRKADYRELARRLWKDCRDTGLKSALLIAVPPQSELATFAASLAIALADLRRGSVLLLDGEVRDRRLTTALQQAATPGWLNTLGGNEVAAPPVVPTRTDGLEFMPAGQTERPLSREDSGAIADAIRELTGRCDLLVVDGGALPALATELLAGACDVTYPLLSLGTTQVDDATAAVEQIQDAGGRVPGCFATHAPRS